MVLLRRASLCVTWTSPIIFRNPWPPHLYERFLSSSSTIRVRSKNTNYRFRGRGPGNSVLLDRFIKFTPLDASLITKAPFNLKCCGSFFDSDNNIDTVRNFSVGQTRDELKREEKLARRRETRIALEEEILGVEEQSTDSLPSEDRDEDHKGVAPSVKMPVPDLPKHYQNVLNYLHKQPQNKDNVYISLEELDNIKSRLEAEETDVGNTEPAGPGAGDRMDLVRKLFPVHVKLFGRSHHRVDSYSIHSGHRMTGSHVYISDADTAEQALAMFAQNQEQVQSEKDQQEMGNHQPKGSIDILSLRDSEDSVQHLSQLQGGWEQEVTSSLRVYCPNHVLDSLNHGIKAVFFTPIMMNRIFLEAERQGSIELNCKLMDQLTNVGLVTEYGQIKVRDVWAQEIRLATRFGDILCDGTLEGDIWAETLGDGDFVARMLVGPSLRVTTDSGDIRIWDDCFAEVAELFTISGHVHCRRLYGAAKIVIKEEGQCTVNVVEGSVDAVVKVGDIVAHLDKLTEDSFLEVETGNIHIHIPPNFPYRVSLLASKNTISPHILNTGEFSLATNGQELFVSGVDSFPGDMEQPSLTVRCHQGEITLQGPRPEKQLEEGFDTR